MQATNFRHNNFDLIRLFAALQVAIYHAIIHLKAAALEPLGTVFGYFPGVPIFFVISGFLISMSWNRAPSLHQYIRNRLLRIYPALWVCLIFSTAIFVSSGIKPDSASAFAKWVVTQTTFFQFYNPNFLREFGVGVINGSLWTIPVELQFYILLPLLALPTKRRDWLWLAYGGAAALLMLLSRGYILERDTIQQKLFSVSIIPYLFYFLVGVIIRLIYKSYPRFFNGKFFIWGSIYLLWAIVETSCGIGGARGNGLNVLSIILLGLLTVSAAFSNPHLSSRLLRDNDLSYGLYIYHMPIINYLLFLGISGVAGFVLALVVSLVIAGISWRFIEKPALSLKNYSLRSKREDCHSVGQTN